ncbi:hypothetical protein L249_4397 [Ophiocordyceps polyrhachis-furcata BCC 54312]|uniref:Uncharacterized protein n=1 Tax=Ophiocordyceps polyrhachis-furcata BCC 54312 TaxID=1330021 RepID=A0A367L7K0_9HYPO|nr:hypothetical protein L249_4397 [Ophiocordyceps polyrhachis-furcata BCC 54312]
MARESLHDLIRSQDHGKVSGYRFLLPRNATHSLTNQREIFRRAQRGGSLSSALPYVCVIDVCRVAITISAATLPPRSNNAESTEMRRKRRNPRPGF